MNTVNYTDPEQGLGAEGDQHEILGNVVQRTTPNSAPLEQKRSINNNNNNIGSDTVVSSEENNSQQNRFNSPSPDDDDVPVVRPAGRDGTIPPMDDKSGSEEHHEHHEQQPTASSGEYVSKGEDDAAEEPPMEAPTPRAQQPQPSAVSTPQPPPPPPVFRRPQTVRPSPRANSHATDGGRHSSYGQGEAYRASTPRRSGSVYSTRSGASPASLMLDPSVQRLQRESCVSAARYHSARRSSSVQRSIGISEGGSLRQRPLTESERYAMECMEANHVHRVSVYERAVDIELARMAYCTESQLNRGVEASERQRRLMAERDKRREASSVSRSARMEEAESRRVALEAERQRCLADSIEKVDRVVQDPYKLMHMKYRYSTPGMRGSDVPAITASRQTVNDAHAEEGGNSEHRRGRSGTPRRSGSCDWSRSSSVTHKRAWR